MFPITHEGIYLLYTMAFFNIDEDQLLGLLNGCIPDQPQVQIEEHLVERWMLIITCIAYWVITMHQGLRIPRRVLKLQSSPAEKCSPSIYIQLQDFEVVPKEGFFIAQRNNY